MSQIKHLRKPHFRIAALALLLLILPSLLRHLFYYEGVVRRWERDIPLPSYNELELERPELSTLPKPNEANSKINTEVLFDISHGNMFTLSELETLTDYIIHNGGHINVTDYYASLDNQLQKADSFVIIAPTFNFEESERQAVARFVERGGRLLVIADPTRGIPDEFFILEDVGGMGNIDICNLLLEPFEITYSKAYMYNLIKNEGNFRNVYFTIIDESPISEGLEEVVFYGLHAIKTAPNPFIIGDGNTLSSLTDRSGGMVAAASDAQGNVLALTDMNFMLPPYHRVADNGVLTKNIANFLSSAPRERSMADFPYIFTRPVTLLVDGEKALDTTMIATINGAQQSMAEMGLELSIASQPEFGHDLVAFGLFPPEENLEPLLEPYELVFSGFEEDEVDMEGEEETVEEPAVEIPATAEELLAVDASEIEAVLEAMSDEESEALFSAMDEDQLDQFFTKMEEATDAAFEEEEDGPTVDVPGFGKVRADGIGLILFNAESERSTVVLMADTEYNLEMLASSFYSGSIDNCAIQGQIAVCVLDEFSGDDYWDDEYDYDYDYSDEFDENDYIDEYIEPVG